MIRKESSDPDGLLLKAQNIILFSLTNFYYDDDRKVQPQTSVLKMRLFLNVKSLQLITDKNMVGRLPILLKDTLQCDNESGSQYRPAAFTCDLPTVSGYFRCLYFCLFAKVTLLVHNTTTRLPPVAPPETSLQLMRRLSPPQSPNRPDSPSSMGILSPASSPPHLSPQSPHRTFKRRRCSPVRSESDLSASESDVDTS